MPRGAGRAAHGRAFEQEESGGALLRQHLPLLRPRDPHDVRYVLVASFSIHGTSCVDLLSTPRLGPPTGGPAGRDPTGPQSTPAAARAATWREGSREGGERRPPPPVNPPPASHRRGPHPFP